jgi:hypothetical protein
MARRANGVGANATLYQPGGQLRCWRSSLLALLAWDVAIRH